MTQDDLFLQHSQFEDQLGASLKGSKEVYKIFWGKVFIMKVILAVWNPHLMKRISDIIVTHTCLSLATTNSSPSRHGDGGRLGTGTPTQPSSRDILFLLYQIIPQRYIWVILTASVWRRGEVDVCYWNLKFISFKVQRTICLLCPSSQTLTVSQFYCTKRPSSPGNF